MQVVWFKRDLRVQDHAALAQAGRTGAVLPLYVVEPDMWRQPDASGRHWDFIAETLKELRCDLAALGQPLILRVGEIRQVLSDLRQRKLITALWSHQETGNAWSYARDQAVAAWCREQSVPWTELQNHGVVRGLRTRDGWAQRWDRYMDQPTARPAPLRPLDVMPGRDPLGARSWPCARPLHRAATRRASGRAGTDGQLFRLSRGTLPKGNVEPDRRRHGLFPPVALPCLGGAFDA